MKTNVSIELTDGQRDHLATLIDGKQSKRLATRADICALVLACIDRALEVDPETTAEPLGEMRADPDVPVDEFSGVRVLSNVVIEDIDRGAWSFLDRGGRGHE